MDAKLEKLVDNFKSALKNADLDQLNEQAPLVFQKRNSLDKNSADLLKALVHQYSRKLLNHNDYDKLQQLLDVLRDNNPPLYEMHCVQFNIELIQYYAYQRASEEKIAALFYEVWSKTEDILDIAVLTDVFFYLAYYGYDLVIEDVMEELYRQLNLWSHDAGLAMAYWHFSRLLDAHYAENNSMTEQDLQQIIERNKELFGLGLNEDMVQQFRLVHIHKGIKSKEQWDELYYRSRLEAYAFVEYDAQVKLFQKGIPFYVSQIIWYNLRSYFNPDKRSYEPFFLIDDKTFVDFLQHTLERKDQAMVIWGLPYVIEYLYEEGFFEIYHKKLQLELVDKLKEAFIHKYRFELWKFSFVHLWQQEVNEEERALFDRSFEASHEEIAQGAVGDPTLGRLGNPFEKLLSSRRVERNIKRNEKVSVKYYDGTVKKNIKYKFVMKEIETGKCDIIDA